MNLKKTKLIISSVFLLAYSFIFTTAAHASPFEEIMGGLGRTKNAAGYPDTQFVPAWANYVSGFLTLMGALFLIMTIYGGWIWMTARGNEQEVAKAKKMIINALIGLLIIFVARIAVEFIISSLGSSSSGT